VFALCKFISSEKRTLYLAGDLAGAKDPNRNSGSLTLQLGFLKKLPWQIEFVDQSFHKSERW
jgi:hypothetical protein